MTPPDCPTTTTTTPSAFTNPDALGGVIGARWDVTPDVRDRLAAPVHDVITRLADQIVDDTSGLYGGEWLEEGDRGANGRTQLHEVEPRARWLFYCSTPTATSASPA